MSEKDINNLKEMLVDFNEYSTDYTKTRCRELEETIENTLKEIERLNNIINELEKVLKECMQHYDYLYDELEEKEALDIYYIYKYVFDKLQELKGSNK